MKCPQCVTPDLLMSERQGIEIDYCPQCRGVWLDRGELDKIIERSLAATVLTTAVSHSQSMPMPENSHEVRHGHGDKHGYNPQSYPRKKSVWSELFD